MRERKYKKNSDLHSTVQHIHDAFFIIHQTEVLDLEEPKQKQTKEKDKKTKAETTKTESEKKKRKLQKQFRMLSVPLINIGSQILIMDGW